jgi:hypothetical protein
MSAPPLTHREILELVAPFARRGRHVDLAASLLSHGVLQVDGLLLTLTPPAVRAPAAQWRR